MQPIISVENLSKAFKIGVKDEVPDTLIGAVKKLAASPLRNFKKLQSVEFKHADTNLKPAQSEDETLWALKNVSFDIHEGDVVGIIGRNGAGKSTLLKILSRITEPTHGRVVIRGRISSLLEVGTGFHPELTGRENVYMNGTILGMTKQEIDRKFDEIVDFSGIEKFLDTPTKRYSSGMQVRLAFSVAAHLEPEVLVIDEVLAVGDVEFQQRCLGKMNEVAKTGRTVLFVSHNMAAVENLCTSAIQLNAGEVTAEGPATTLVASYRDQAHAISKQTKDPFADSKYFRGVTLLDEVARATTHLPLGSRFKVNIEMNSHRTIKNPKIGIGIDTIAGDRVLSLQTPNSRQVVPTFNGGCEVSCTVQQLPLAPGTYTVRLVLEEKGHALDSVEDAFQFSVTDAHAFGEGRGFHRGTCIAPSTWLTK